MSTLPKNISAHILFLTYILLIGLTTPAFLNWPVKIAYWTFALVLFWLVGAQSREISKYKNIKISREWFFLLFIIFAISRLLPFFRWGELPLGADAALYLNQLNFLPAYLVYAYYIFLNFLVGWGVYLVTKEYFDQEAAYFSWLIFTLSVSQFLVYWIFYFKAMPAIVLFLLFLYLLKRQSYLAIPVAGLMAYWHSPTFLPVLPSLFVSGFLVKQKRFIWISIVVIALTFLTIHWQRDFFSYLHYLQQYLDNDSLGFVKLIGGYFSAPDFYVGFLALFYLPFALIGALRLLKNGQLDYLLPFLLVMVVLIPLNFLFFNNRLIILVDLLLIIIAAPVVADFVRLTHHRWGSAFLPLILLLITGHLFHQSWRMEPLINAAELREIKDLAKKERELPIYTTSPLYNHVLTYSQHPIIESPNGIVPPFYIYHGRRSEVDFESMTLEKISNHVWKKR